ncbi:MAG TPA: cytidine deaminase [Bacteroidales bacterium]|nr:cytidine deaminase [Bacteroidales bacterium]
MEKLRLTIEFEYYRSSDELSEAERELFRAAMDAAKNAYAPYSLYKVGAAVRLESGRIVTGNNQENVAYPSGLCAERVALFYASANYPDDHIVAIAIAANAVNFTIKDKVTPCGACRQVMKEAENQNKHTIRVIMQGENGAVYISNSVENLLPISFKANELKKISNNS